MITNQYKAALTLGAVSLGFFISYPFQDFFAGGLISSACGAAMIGGLADWFAVEALFRRPLGIPFRTAIIPRSRERIFEALADMVEDELLTPENIRKTLSRYNLSQIMAEYLMGRQGGDNLRQALAKVIFSIVGQVKPEKVARVTELVGKRTMEETDLAKLLAKAIDWLLANGYEKYIIEFAAGQMVLLARHEKMHALLVELLAEACKTYEKGLVKRKLFNLLLNVSPEEVADIIQQAFAGVLDSIRRPDHPFGDRIREWLAGLSLKLKTEEGLRQDIEEWKQNRLKELSFRQQLTESLEDFKQKIGNNPEIVDEWLNRLQVLLVHFIAEIVADENRQAVFEAQVKTRLIGGLNLRAGVIGGIVRESLGRFSDEELAAFIEAKVGNDLQMIRINGSVVGGLVGALIFLVFHMLL